MFHYFLIFDKKDSKNLVTSKMGNNLNLFYCNFFCLFSKIYVNACYVFESLDTVSWMTTEWECNAWLCLAGHLFIWYANEMYAYALGDIFSFFYNGVIVMNLLLYTRKGESKWRK